MRNVSVNVSGPIQASSTYKTIVLKGNLPFAAQLAGEDIKYVIKYDFNLAGETVTIPKNCILEFDGGSLLNGTVVGQETLFINVGDVVIWGRNLVRQGSWVKWGHDETIIDDHLSTKSTNPVQNKVATQELQSRYTKDETYAKSEVYNKNEVYSKQETYPKESLYTKDEVYPKSDVYKKNETYNSNEVYNKAEVDSLLSNSPETQKVMLVVPEGSTAADVLDAVPTEDRPNKLFWVRNDSNTHFDEYGWTGTVWELLASHDYGIDEEIIEGSTNLVTGGGVAKTIKNTESGIAKFGLLDANNNVIAFLTKEEVLRLFVGLSVDKIEAEDISVGDGKVVISNTRKSPLANFVLQTEDGSVVLGIDKDNKKFGNLARKSVHDLNIDKDGLMHSAADFPRGQKRAQIMTITDTHENVTAFERFVEALGDFESVKCGLHMGDIINNGATSNISLMEHLSQLVRNAKKPLFFCVGNHDSGTMYRAIPGCASDWQLYNWFVKPAIDNGWLRGEYDEETNPAGDYILGKLYYSHKFDDDTLLIVLYPFDDGNVIADQVDESFVTYRGKHVEDHSYWKPIPYLPSYDSITAGEYHVDDIVNIPNYTEFSFQCIADVKLKRVSWDRTAINKEAEKYPKYRALRKWRWYGEQQLRWFCKKLEYARDNNLNVIVAQHLSFSNDMAENVNSALSTGVQIEYMPYANRYDKLADDNSNQDVILDIINACKTKARFSCALYPKSTYQDEKYYDNTSSIEGFDFYYDFRSNEDGAIPGLILIDGHVHKGGLAHHRKYGFMQLTQDTGKVYDTGLIGSSGNTNNISFDHINVLTMLPAVNMQATQTLAESCFVRKNGISGGADIVDDDAYNIKAFSVNEGTTYYFSSILPVGAETEDGRAIPFVAWFDADRNCIKIEDYFPTENEDGDGYATVDEQEIKAPEGAAFLYMNTYKDKPEFSLSRIYRSIHVTRLGNSYMTRVDADGEYLMDRNNTIIKISND